MTEAVADASTAAGGIAARLAQVRARIAAAERAAGRDPGSVRLLLATKTQPAAHVRAALDADRRALATHSDGHARPVLLGENRVQELVAKAPELVDLDPELHLIGPLQSNKVNAALRWASCVQSVDTLALAHRLGARRADEGRVLDVLVQVNVSGEPTKHGATPGDAAALALAVAQVAGLRLRGLMTVGANATDPDRVRGGYALLRRLLQDVVTSGGAGVRAADELSMGMSRDLELAIAEGATIVRTGTAVFGDRPA